MLIFLLTLWRLLSQGTNVSSITSLLNDANIVRDDRDSRLSFLGADASITGGFQDAWLDTADAVLGELIKFLLKSLQTWH